jgi:hypothetical protein
MKALAAGSPAGALLISAVTGKGLAGTRRKPILVDGAIHGANGPGQPLPRHPTVSCERGQRNSAPVRFEKRVLVVPAAGRQPDLR